MPKSAFNLRIESCKKIMYFLEVCCYKIIVNELQILFMFELKKQIFYKQLTPFKYHGVFDLNDAV